MSERDDTPVMAPATPAAPAPVRQVRLTDPERDAAHERLRQALDLGALDLEEYGDRYALVISARNRGGSDRAPRGPARRGARTDTDRRDVLGTADRGGDRWLVAVMGGHEESGSWDAGDRIHAIAAMGGVDADLRHATMNEHLVIDATALMGGIDIIVPDGAEVRMSGFALMGGRSNTAKGPRQPGAPLIEVKAFALMGGVDVRHAKRRSASAPSATSPRVCCRRRRRCAGGRRPGFGLDGGGSVRAGG